MRVKCRLPKPVDNEEDQDDRKEDDWEENLLENKIHDFPAHAEDEQ